MKLLKTTFALLALFMTVFYVYLMPYVLEIEPCYISQIQPYYFINSVISGFSLSSVISYILYKKTLKSLKKEGFIFKTNTDYVSIES